MKSEISRLSRKEIRGEITSLKKASAASRRHIASLKRQVTALERMTLVLAKQNARGAKIASADQDGQPMRFQARGLPSLRKRLGVSQAQLARLLEVSDQSVYNWERGKAAPRKEALAAIVALRSMGKREVHAKLGPREKAQALAKNLRKPAVRSKRASVTRKVHSKRK